MRGRFAEVGPFEEVVQDRSPPTRGKAALRLRQKRRHRARLRIRDVDEGHVELFEHIEPILETPRFAQRGS